MEGLCTLLRRLPCPCRFVDMIPRFGSPVPVISMVTNHAIDFIYSTHEHRITPWNDALLNPFALEMYMTKGLHSRIALLSSMGLCSPLPDQISIREQCTMAINALKFQSLVLPNGFIANLYGPVGNYVFQDAVIYQLLIHIYLYCFVSTSPSPRKRLNLKLPVIRLWLGVCADPVQRIQQLWDA